MFASTIGGIAELKINPAGPSQAGGVFISHLRLVATGACRFALEPTLGSTIWPTFATPRSSRKTRLMPLESPDCFVSRGHL
jgi:hypothetical protein